MWWGKRLFNLILGIKMDENIIIASYHEAGHALMAYIVGWSINSIELYIQNNRLTSAITNYDFGLDLINDSTNLNRRLLCLMGGPISQALFQGINQIDIDILGQDGVTIDNLLAHLNRQAKENIIQTSMNTTATFMSFNDNIIARQQIAEILIERHNIYTDEFHQIMSLNNVRQMNFN